MDKFEDSDQIMDIRYAYLVNRKPWNSKDAEKALNAEKQALKNQKYICVTFPDGEVNRAIVSEFDTHISYKAFKNSGVCRKCVIQLKDDADIPYVINKLNSTRFHNSFVKAELKFIDKTPKDSIDKVYPFELYITNLPINVTSKTIEKKFPKATDIRFKYSCGCQNRSKRAILTFSIVEDAVEAYETNQNLIYDGQSAFIRFRRIKTPNASQGKQGEVLKNYKMQIVDSLSLLSEDENELLTSFDSNTNTEDCVIVNEFANTDSVVALRNEEDILLKDDYKYTGVATSNDIAEDRFPEIIRTCQVTEQNITSNGKQRKLQKSLNNNIENLIKSEQQTILETTVLSDLKMEENLVETKLKVRSFNNNNNNNNSDEELINDRVKKDRNRKKPNSNELHLKYEYDIDKSKQFLHDQYDDKSIIDKDDTIIVDSSEEEDKSLKCNASSRSSIKSNFRNENVNLTNDYDNSVKLSNQFVTDFEKQSTIPVQTDNSRKSSEYIEENELRKSYNNNNNNNIFDVSSDNDIMRTQSVKSRSSSNKRRYVARKDTLEGRRADSGRNPSSSIDPFSKLLKYLMDCSEQTNLGYDSSSPPSDHERIDETGRYYKRRKTFSPSNNGGSISENKVQPHQRSFDNIYDKRDNNADNDSRNILATSYSSMRRNRDKNRTIVDSKIDKSHKNNASINEADYTNVYDDKRKRTNVPGEELLPKVISTDDNNYIDLYDSDEHIDSISDVVEHRRRDKTDRTENDSIANLLEGDVIRRMHAIKRETEFQEPDFRDSNGVIDYETLAETIVGALCTKRSSEYEDDIKGSSLVEDRILTGVLNNEKVNLNVPFSMTKLLLKLNRMLDVYHAEVDKLNIAVTSDPIEEKRIGHDLRTTFQKIKSLIKFQNSLNKR